MLGDGIGSNVRKSKLINRRMFLASAAKAVVFFGIIGRCFIPLIRDSTVISVKVHTLSSIL